MVLVDLRVTKATIKIIHTPFLALELQNYAEWTQSRNQVPYALAQKGITLQDWTNIFDKADALWERRTMEAIELNRGIHNRKKSSSRYILAFYLVIFGLLGAMIILGLIYGESWMVSLGLGSMVVVPIVVCTLLSKYDRKRAWETWDVIEASMEQDWLLLADEQRRKFEWLGIDVEPIREDHSGDIGKFVSKLLGRDFTIADGLRFSVDQEEQDVQATTNSEGSLPMLGNGIMIADAAIHDLDRLLQLNQTHDVKIEYELLKSRILAKMSLPFQYVSLPTDVGQVEHYQVCSRPSAVVASMRPHRRRKNDHVSWR
jgi:hypothetical protein